MNNPEPQPAPTGHSYADAAAHAGSDDGFDRLWTPHRMAYIADGETRSKTQPSGCPFCDIPAGDDDAGLIVARGETSYVVLNKYPYNSGHLMVVPYRHVADYAEADTEEITEIAQLTQRALRTLSQVSTPHGFNIGINLGDAGGAGIAAHLHQHIVPRWQGDANFMPVIAHTKVLPQLLAETRDMLAAAW